MNLRVAPAGGRGGRGSAKEDWPLRRGVSQFRQGTLILYQKICNPTDLQLPQRSAHRKDLFFTKDPNFPYPY